MPKTSTTFIETQMGAIYGWRSAISVGLGLTSFISLLVFGTSRYTRPAKHADESGAVGLVVMSVALGYLVCDVSYGFLKFLGVSDGADTSPEITNQEESEHKH
jgi:hypothetical protein